MKNKIFLMPVIFAGILSLAFREPVPGSTGNRLVIQFDHFFAKQPLEFGREYVNAHGEKLNVKTLNYYVSNLSVILSNGKEYVIPQDQCYFLIRHSDPASTRIVLGNLPVKKIREIRFMIGVDSLRNTADVSRRTGALDVGAAGRGMYWSWNSGYIFFKFEGRSPVIADSQRNSFQYHIGGFGGYQSKTINNIRIKSLDLGEVVSLRRKVPVVHVEVDVARVFDAKNPIRLSKHSNIMWGPMSVDISNNYKETFSLGRVEISNENQLR